VGAVPTKQPGVVQGKNYRNLVAEPGEVSQIKVFSVKVMCMDNVRPTDRQV
jgi:hypothetical protein